MIEVARVASACSTEEADWSDGGTKRWSFGNNTNPEYDSRHKKRQRKSAKCYGFEPFLFYMDENSKGHVKRKLSYTLVTTFGKN